MEDIKISVVVPTYNHEKYIGQALQSIVEQELEIPFEVLVGDDCSTDNTSIVVRKYAEKYPDLIIPLIREKNLGMSQNMEDLVMRTRGKYVAFLEGDDYWIDHHKLLKQYDFMEKNEDYVATFGKCIIVDAEGKRNKEMEQYKTFFQEHEFTMENFKNYELPGQTATAFYRKAGFLRLMQEATAKSFEIKYMQVDMMLILHMMAIGKIWNSQDEVAAYRYVLTPGSGSWSSQHDYFSFNNEYAFLMGLKELEMVAEAYDLPLCYDDRRQYEMCVLAEHKDDLSKEELGQLRKVILDTCKDKMGMLFFLLKRKFRYIFDK